MRTKPYTPGRFVLAVVVNLALAVPLALALSVTAALAIGYLLRPIVDPLAYMWVYLAFCALAGGAIGYGVGRYVAGWLYDRLQGR